MKLLKLILISLPAIFLLNPVFAADELPIAGYNASRDYPGAHLTPDPDTAYKVVFDLVVTDDNLDDPYPMLPLVARYVNTLANLGVPRHDGKDNPNIDLIKQLHAAGVTFHLCGQGVLSRNIEEDDLLDEIQVDYWALTTLIELGRQGYVKIGG